MGISHKSSQKVKNNKISPIHFEEGKILKWVSSNKSQKAKVIGQNYQISANLQNSNGTITVHNKLKMCKTNFFCIIKFVL